MSTSRRTFIKTVGVSTVALASADAVADLLAQSPRGRVLDSKFKGLSDVALADGTVDLVGTAQRHLPHHVA